MVLEIPWGDGSGDKIYLSLNASEGDQAILVTSDANGGNVSRSKNITFSASSGQSSISRVLTVVQNPGGTLTIITHNNAAIVNNQSVVGYGG